MELLYALESIRTPFLDKLMGLITNLGGEAVFIVAAIVVFWCLSKSCGYYMMTVGFAGTIINQFLKLWFRIPRPWVKDPNFTIVESARAEATGYSFPSGHTQNAFAVFGSPARFFKNTALRIIFIFLIALTAFSRMYVGVHTPLDVGVSSYPHVISYSMNGNECCLFQREHCCQSSVLTKVIAFRELHTP